MAYERFTFNFPVLPSCYIMEELIRLKQRSRQTNLDSDRKMRNNSIEPNKEPLNPGMLRNARSLETLARPSFREIGGTRGNREVESRNQRVEWSCRTAIYRFGARAQPDRWLRLTFTITGSRTRSSFLSLSSSHR